MPSEKISAMVEVKGVASETTIAKAGVAFGVQVNTASAAAVCTMEIGGVDVVFNVKTGNLSQMFIFPKPVAGAVKIALTGTGAAAYVFYGA